MTDKTELRDLERRLALVEAGQRLSVLCQIAKGGWHDTTTCQTVWGELLDEATRYLDLRGLLERKPDAPHLVRVKGGES